MIKSSKIGDNEFEHTLPDKPEVHGDNFLNKARPAKGEQKLFSKIAAGVEINEAEERQLRKVTDKLWRLRENAIKDGDAAGEEQIGYVYALVAKLEEYARSIKGFLQEMSKAEKEMNEIKKDESEFEKLQRQGQIKKLATNKKAAIKQLRVMVKNVQQELAKIPLYFGGPALFGKILAILSPLGLLASFHPLDDQEIIQDQQTQVAERAIETVEDTTGQYDDGDDGTDGYGDKDASGDEGWMQDEEASGGGHGGRGGRGGGGGGGRGGHSFSSGLEDVPAGRPNMDSGGETKAPGKDGGVGTFEFTSENFRRLLDGKLWVTGMKKPEEASSSYEYSYYNGPALDVVAAKATVNIPKPAPNKRYRLPHPIGTRVVNVQVEPETLKISKTDSLDILVFEAIPKGTKSVRITYDLALVEGRFGSSTQLDSHSGPLDADAQKTVDRLRSGQDSTEAVLREYLSNYTYITSNQLQRLLNKIPGSYQEKMQSIRFGDCDMLSDRGGYLLQRSGIPAMTTVGFMDMGANKLSAGSRHAQILFKSPGSADEGGLKEFETTGVASIHGAYEGVRFKKKDYDALSSIVDKIKAARSDEFWRKQGYKEFDLKLRQILSGKDYQRFKQHGEMGDFASILRDMAEQLMKQDGLKKASDAAQKARDANARRPYQPREMNWLDQLDSDIDDILGPGAVGTFRIVLILLACAMFLGTLGAIGAGVKKVHELEGDRQVRKIKSRVKAAAERMLREASAEGRETTESPESEPSYFSSREMIPKEIYDQATPEIKHALQIMASTIGVIGPEKVIRYHLFGKSKMEGMFKRLDQQGYDSKQLMGYFKEMFESPKLRALADSQREADKGEILKRATKIASRFVGGFKNPKPSDHIKIQTKILNLRRAGDETVNRSKSSVFDGPFPSGESRPYQPGDDMRDIDWNYYARSDELHVDLPEKQVDVISKARDRYALVVDVASANNKELSRLLALFYYIQKHPGQVAITGIELYAHGKRLSAEEAPMQTGEGSGVHSLIRKLCVDSPDGRKNAQAFVKTLVDLSWKHKWYLKSSEDDHASRWPSRYGKAARVAKSEKDGEKLLCVGAYDGWNDLVYHFPDDRNGEDEYEEAA